MPRAERCLGTRCHSSDIGAGRERRRGFFFRRVFFLFWRMTHADLFCHTFSNVGIMVATHCADARALALDLSWAHLSVTLLHALLHFTIYFTAVYFILYCNLLHTLLHTPTLAHEMRVLSKNTRGSCTLGTH